MQTIGGEEPWVPKAQESMPDASPWVIMPEQRYFVGKRPQQFVVVPPESEQSIDAALMQLAQVRGLPNMMSTRVEGQAVQYVPPEFETGTPIEVLNELGIILTDLSSEQAMSLAERGFEVYVNEVRYVPPVPVVTRLLSPVEGMLTEVESMTWGLQAIGLKEPSQWTGRGIKVAVLDTGCSPTHPDFVGRIKAKNAISFVTGEAPVDGHGHGTHVCGTVAGPLRPKNGARYGIAPDCELLVVKVLSNSGAGYDSWILKGLNWAIAQGADVINMSLGSARRVGEPASLKYEALARNHLTGSNSTVIVAAAGNDSNRPQSVAPVGNPAACPSIMAVAAVDNAGTVAPFSCGAVDSAALDLAAPGVNIFSAALSGGIVPFDGTSMASPHVAGAAALWAESDPSLRGRALWGKLLSTVASLKGTVNDVGAGLVQVP